MNRCPRSGVRLLTAVAFLCLSITPPCRAQELYNLPPPGTMILPTPNFLPPLIKGITIHPENPLQFDFLIHNGEKDIAGMTLEEESIKQIKYFLAAMTIPEERMWVNLSPYEQGRIISADFGTTEMGKDLLMQDYILKQLTASLIYPEEEVGRKFWERTYKRAYELLGTTEIPINTFNKVWIVPDKAVVYERNNTVFVLESRLKVMWEKDYLASKAEVDRQPQELPVSSGSEMEQLTEEAARIVREVLIPEIEREVNEGETFVELRQIYQSMILAAWYKVYLKNSLLGQVYADKSKTKGVHVDDPSVNKKVYEQYLAAYKKGVYNFSREEYDPQTQEVTSRVYFSGGFDPAMMSSRVLEEVTADSAAARADFAMLGEERDKLDLVVVELEETDLQQFVGDAAMIGIARFDAKTEITTGLADQIEKSAKEIPFKFILMGYLGALTGRLESLERESERNYLIAQGVSPQVVTETARQNAEDNRPEMERIQRLIAGIRAELGSRGDQTQASATSTIAAAVEEQPAVTAPLSTRAAQPAQPGLFDSDPAMLTEQDPVGGIDFDPALLNLQIRRDGQGVALRMDEQDLSRIKIEGLYPVIVRIIPVAESPLQLSELFPAEPISAGEPAI